MNAHGWIMDGSWMWADVDGWSERDYLIMAEKTFPGRGAPKRANRKLYRRIWPI